MRRLLGLLIPAHALADARAELPAPALGNVLRGGVENVELGSRIQPSARDRGALALGEHSPDAREVERDGLPPAPVIGDGRAEQAQVHRVRVLGIGERERDEQPQAVVDVLLVELDDLQLRQQQIHRIERVRQPGQAVADSISTSTASPVCGLAKDSCLLP